jgi:phospholipase C
MDVLKDRIKHIVVLMLENRSLDHVLGCLYDEVKNPPPHTIPKAAAAFYDGVLKNGAIKKECANTYTYYKGTKSKTVPLTLIPCSEIEQGAPAYDPPEPYLDVNQQLYGSEAGPAQGQTAGMSGFVQNFYDKKCYTTSEEATVESIMKCYGPDQLPVLYSLARHYAVSDRWFSSVPTQTNSNRAFLLCGTSLGRTDNMGFEDTLKGKDSFATPTIFNVLDANEPPVSWAVFYKDQYPISEALAKQHPDVCALARQLGLPCPSPSCYTQLTFPKIPNRAGSFLRIETDFKNLVKTGDLPEFSFLEPGSWGGEIEYKGYELKRVAGDDYHPPGPLVHGERFLADIYQTLTSNPDVWNTTLLVVTFDEHGGTYDHVPPPWGAADPDGRRDKEYGHDFAFDRFGVRVPALLISPWIEKGTVFRSETGVPYDHTSIIATVLKWKDIDPGTKVKPLLGKRVVAAPLFDNVLTLDAARTDTLDLPISMLDHLPPCMKAGHGGRWDGSPNGADGTWISLNKLSGKPVVQALGRTELHLSGPYDFIDPLHPLGPTKGTIDLHVWQLSGDNRCQLRFSIMGDLAKEYFGNPHFDTGAVTATYAAQGDGSIVYRVAGATGVTVTQRPFKSRSGPIAWYAGVEFDFSLPGGKQYHLCFEDMDA